MQTRFVKRSFHFEDRENCWLHSFWSRRELGGFFWEHLGDQILTANVSAMKIMNFYKFFKDLIFT